VSNPWIPRTGRDAGPRCPSWINPGGVVEVTFWTDDSQRRVATVQLVDGRTVELREPEAISAVGTVTRGDPDPEPEPMPIAARACARR